MSTPEGSPHRCPVCGKPVCIEPSDPAGDAPCPNCGRLLRWFRQKLSERFGINPSDVQLNSSYIGSLGADSLDIVELVIEIEDAFRVTIPDERAEQIRTVRDAMEIIGEQLGDDWVPDEEDEPS